MFQSKKDRFPVVCKVRKKRAVKGFFDGLSHKVLIQDNKNKGLSLMKGFPEPIVGIALGRVFLSS